MKDPFDEWIIFADELLKREDEQITADFIISQRSFLLRENRLFRSGMIS